MGGQSSTRPPPSEEQVRPSLLLANGVDSLMARFRHDLAALEPNIVRSLLVPTTRSLLVPTTRSLLVPTTHSLLVPNTHSLLVPTTRSLLVPTTCSLLVPTTRSLLVPTTHSILVPTTRSLLVPFRARQKHAGDSNPFTPALFQTLTH
jgi:hypothetical protein